MKPSTRAVLAIAASAALGLAAACGSTDRATGDPPPAVPPPAVPPTGVPPSGVSPSGVSPSGVSPSGVPPTAVHDLSLLVSPELPCVWPVGMVQHVVVPSRTFGPGPYHRDLVVIDEHTGTQWDAPAHFVPPPGSGLPGEGLMGLVTGDKVPAWQLAGEACVIDLGEHSDDAPPGSSFLIGPELVNRWEAAHRPVGPGDVVLFRSGYTDRHYKPLAEGGQRFVHAVLRREAPAWPAPTPECMRYLGEKGVMALGIDSPSMGPVPDLAAATHQAGGAFGMVWTECAANLGALPLAGAFYALLPPKHAGGSGSEARALGITEPALAARLIASARAKRVADLSVLLDEGHPVTWPGRGPGEEASRYLGKTLNAFEKARGPYFARMHVLDGQAGTHLVPPSFVLPPPGFDPARFSPEVRRLRAAFEAKHGPLGSSDLTVERVPLASLLGDARVIDVTALAGTTKAGSWPASPRITVERIQEHERATRPIEAGEVVLFRSGYSDAHFGPLPELPAQDRFLAAPLAGKAEGWPAPAPEAVLYLASRGVRLIGTDGPTLGGVEPEAALQVYWAAASRGVLAVEMLTGLGSLPEGGAFFLFAPVKIQGLRGGYGRALALY